MARKQGHRYEDFAWSVNLPRTAFPMRGRLARREAAVLRYWQRIDLDGQVRAQSAGCPRFRLHDAPAVGHGPLRLDQARNKILKDIVIKFRTMQGYDAPLVPGWEAHGLATEILATRRMTPATAARHPLEVRHRCALLATAAIARQRAQLRRLGIRAAWAESYATLQPSYEAGVLRVFKALVTAGLVYRAPLPVTWCPTCGTPLADAELEMHPQPVDAIHLAVPVQARPSSLFPGVEQGRMAAAVFSTAPWTLPAATALAMHPDITYALVTDADDPEGFAYLVARDRVRVFGHTVAMRQPAVLHEASGGALAQMRFLNPVSGRALPVVLTTRVTSAPGTGLRLLTPSLNTTDFAIAREQEVPLCPILDDHGRLRPVTGPYAGQTLAEAQRRLLRQLDHDGVLLAHVETQELQPCCWHCRGTAVTRVTPQWFLAIEPLRATALAVAAAVRWQPAWGQAQLASLLRARPDWCLSRRRAWGIPLPVLYCDGCHEPLLDPAVIDRAIDLVAGEGSGVWYTRPAREFIPDGTRCPQCGGTRFRKGHDTFDAGFDAACSPLATPRDAAPVPADLALESHDHFRGWFQLALLISLGAGESPPYRAARAHGFVLPRTATPARTLLRDGADVLRLWTAMTDSRADTIWSPAALAQARRAYRRLRNTTRFLLGNLYDFHPRDMRIAVADMGPLDRWALGRLHALVVTVTAALEASAPHRALQALLACGAALSTHYFTVVKDILYLAPADDPARRGTQTAFYTIAETLARLLAPLLSFTAEEIWRHLPTEVRPPSPQLATWPAPDPAWVEDDALATAWATVTALRAPIHAAVGTARARGIITSAKEAKVLLPFAGESIAALEVFGQHFPRMFGVADITIAPVGTRITVVSTAGDTCPRCRRHRPLGGVPAFPTLCAGCAETVGNTPRSSWPVA